MKNSLRILCLVSFLFATNFGKAQPVITEYFTMRESIKIDLNDKKIQKIVYAKGILDVSWNPSDLLLAITYDPKAADNKDIWKSIQEVVDLNSANPSNSKQSTK